MCVRLKRSCAMIVIFKNFIQESCDDILRMKCSIYDNEFLNDNLIMPRRGDLSVSI